MPRLIAQNVGFTYGGAKNRPVLQNVTLELLPGQLTVLLGPNGSGKSTLVRCLAGMQRATTGKVLFSGDDVSRLPARVLARRIAYAPQTLVTPFAFTVRELIGLSTGPATGAGGADGSDLSALLATFDLEGMAERSLLTLSGGERQRAASARAFAQRTPCLLLDEPTASLDLRHQATLMQAGRDRAQGHGAIVCVVLHDLNLAASFADRIALLHQGTIAAEGTPDEVLTAPILSRVYGASVQIVRGPQNQPVILPGLPLSPGQAGDSAGLTNI